METNNNSFFTMMFSDTTPQTMDDSTAPIANFQDNLTMILNVNNSVDVRDKTVKTHLLLYDVLIPTIGALIIITNFAVVISSGLLLKKGQQPRSTYLFLGNVAMTDLITGIAVVFGQVFPKSSRDHYVCSLQIGMIVSSTLTSVFSVGLIGIDRFLYILHGLKYQKWVYPTRARLLIVFTWIIGGIIGFLPLMGWYGDTNNGQICWFILLAPKYLVLLTVLAGIIPLLVVITLYSIILYHAIRKIMQLQHADKTRNDVTDTTSGNIRMFRGTVAEEQNQDQPKGFFRWFKTSPSRVKTPNKWKAIKVVLFTTGSFVVTWSPYFIASLIFVFNCDKDSTSKYCKSLRLLIASPLAILGFMNSFLNPIIYAWWHKGFRTFVKKQINVLVMRKKDESQHPTKESRSTEKSSTGTSSNSKSSQVKPI